MVASPNFGERHGRAIDMLLLHYTGMVSGDAALERLRDPAAEVSAHYLVWEDGAIDQLVPETARAWHAGRAIWRGETDINSVSVGIEIVNAGHDGGCPPYSAPQIDAVIALCGDICERRAIAPTRVLGHSDVAPARKQDPGEMFPWEQLADAGIGIWPRMPLAPGGPPQVDLRRADAALGAIGYAPCDGVELAAATIAAFQRHWRPSRVDGRIDAETAVRIAQVERAMAADAF